MIGWNGIDKWRESFYYHPSILFNTMSYINSFHLYQPREGAADVLMALGTFPGIIDAIQTSLLHIVSPLTPP